MGTLRYGEKEFSEGDMVISLDLKSVSSFSLPPFLAVWFSLRIRHCQVLSCIISINSCQSPVRRVLS